MLNFDNNHIVWQWIWHVVVCIIAVQADDTGMVYHHQQFMSS